MWLVRERVGDLLRYRGESDAMIVRGLAAILIALDSGRPAKEIAETDAIAIFDDLGLREHLSTQRSNWRVAMLNRVRAVARAIALGSFGSLACASANHSANRANGFSAAVKSPDVNLVGCLMEAVSVMFGVPRCVGHQPRVPGDLCVGQAYIRQAAALAYRAYARQAC